MRHLRRPAELEIDELGVVSCPDREVNGRRLPRNGIRLPGTSLDQPGPERFLLTRVASAAARIDRLGTWVASTGQELPRGLAWVQERDGLGWDFAPVTGKRKGTGPCHLGRRNAEDGAASDNHGERQQGHRKAHQSTLTLSHFRSSIIHVALFVIGTRYIRTQVVLQT